MSIAAKRSSDKTVIRLRNGGLQMHCQIIKEQGAHYFFCLLSFDFIENIL